MVLGGWGGGVGCVCVHALTLQGVDKGMLLPGYCMSLSFVSVGGPSIDCCFCNLIHSLGQYFSVISSHFVASMKFASGVRYLGFDSNLMSLGGLPRYLLCLGWLHACWALCTFYSLESVKIVVQQGVSQNSIWWYLGDLQRMACPLFFSLQELPRPAWVASSVVWSWWMLFQVCVHWVWEQWWGLWLGGMKGFVMHFPWQAQEWLLSQIHMYEWTVLSG